MRQDLIRRAESMILQKKLRAEREFDEAMAPAYNDKTFEKLNKELTRLQIENARKEVLGEKPDKAKEAKLQDSINQIKAKYHLENVKISYACKTCSDTGYVNGKMCKCLKQELSKISLEESGFGKLENFDDYTKTSGNEKIYALLKEWCNKNSTKNLIYIAGPTGVGKTVLIRCMANELIQNGKVVRLTTAFKMNQDFKEFHKTRNEELLNKYLSAEYLFIDDLGTEPRYKDVTLEYLYLIINERKMKNLPTIITSNLNLKDLLDTYDERISSRIVDRVSSINIMLNGEDKRLKNKLK